MAVADDIRIELGRPLDSAEANRISLYEPRVRADIDRHARLSGLTITDLDAEAVERFVGAAILRKMRNPTGTDRIEVGVDDGRIVQRFPDGRLDYLPEWWAWLGLPAPTETAVGADWSGSIPYAR